MSTTTTLKPVKKPPLGLRLMRRTLKGTPPGPYRVGYEPDLAVPAADGSPLLTDHYVPLGEGDFPTVLIRSPYGRGFPWASMYAMPLAEHGFHVVVQSCRGTGGSGGEFHLLRNEAADGQATVEWLREQPWFTGVLGTIGPSYLAYVQWALALDPPPELRAMVLQVPMHQAHGFYWSGGAFQLESALVGAVGMLNQSRGMGAFLKGAMRLQRNLGAAGRGLPLVDAYVPALGHRVDFLEGAMTHPDAEDPHWDGADVGAAADGLTVPTSLIGGWHDVNLDQTLAAYRRLRRSGCETALLVGPWTHNSALEQGWPEVFAESLGWLRAHLCDQRSELRGRPVRVRVGGTGEWRELAEWPGEAGEADGRRWQLAPGGRLTGGSSTGEGTAGNGSPMSTRPAGNGSSSSMGDVSPSPAERPMGDGSAAAVGDYPLASFRYDPADPTPSVGGQVVSRSGGARDNRKVEARGDVLTFTTEPLAEAVDVLGAVRAELRVGFTAASADVFVRLCDVDPGGRSVNVCDGLLRMTRDGAEPAEVTVAMSSTAHRFRPGHRIRLQISGGAHPRFARNTGSGEPVATAARLEAGEVTVHGPSALLLPDGAN